MEDCDKKKGRDIAELICRVLKEHDIEFKNCRGQGYDNGANMAGIYNGAQAAILEKNPQALFSPCSAHIALIIVGYMQQSRQLLLKASLETSRGYTLCSALVLLVGRFCKRLLVSGVVKGGRGGAIAPPTASKTIFEKSLNPCRSVGGGTCNKNQNQS